MKTIHILEQRVDDSVKTDRFYFSSERKARAAMSEHISKAIYAVGILIDMSVYFSGKDSYTLRNRIDGRTIAISYIVEEIN